MERRRGSKAGYVCRQMLRRYFSDGVAQSAAELAFFLLFTIFPLLMIVNSILAQVNISSTSLLEATQFFPSSIQQVLQSYIEHINQTPSLSPMIVGVILTLYFMSRVIRSLQRTVNRIYRVDLRRNNLHQVLLSFLFTIGFMATMLGCFVIVIIGRAIVSILGQWIELPAFIVSLFRGGSFWIMVAVLFLFLLLFNHVVPNVRLTWREAMPGALFSLMAWVLVSTIFSYYVDNLARYSLLYGSLATIIVLMLWLYLASILLIMGAQVNHILLTLRRYEEKVKRERKDSTIQQTD